MSLCFVWPMKPKDEFKEENYYSINWKLYVDICFALDSVVYLTCRRTRAEALNNCKTSHLEPSEWWNLKQIRMNFTDSSDV